MCFFVWCFFFFKQKTAYEMRISAWGSDVCSSDLDRQAAPVARRPGEAILEAFGVRHRAPRDPVSASHHHRRERHRRAVDRVHRLHAVTDRPRPLGFAADHKARIVDEVDDRQAEMVRSEEHTYELQSLMRISSAVFCLKKKITQR